MCEPCNRWGTDSMADRILIIAHGHPEQSPGGGEIAAYSLFQELKRTDGVEAYFLAWAGAGAPQRASTPFSTFRGRNDELLFAADAFDHFWFLQPIDATVRDRFAFLLRQINPDIIHFHHYSKIGLELIALARRLNPRVRIFVTLHEYLAICHHNGQMVKTGNFALCEEANPRDCAACFTDIAPTEFLLRKLFIQAHFAKVDRLIAPSEFLRRRYIAWGLPSRQIVLLENGTPVCRPPPPRPCADGEPRAIFGFFGQINPYKGLLQLLTAFDYLGQLPAEVTRGIRLIVHGANLETNSPDYVGAVHELLARTAERVHFAGPYDRRDLGGLLAAVDWVVVPSIWWENSPLVIEEALAHRRPVVCSNIGGMAEKVRWGHDGFHFPVGNPFELARLLVRLAGDPAIWNHLQTTIRQPLTTARSAVQHLELFRQHASADLDHARPDVSRGKARKQHLLLSTESLSRA
jgi:glycosyltransferase involved in cell wall biosynthesis